MYDYERLVFVLQEMDSIQDCVAVSQMENRQSVVKRQPDEVFIVKCTEYSE